MCDVKIVEVIIFSLFLLSNLVTFSYTDLEFLANFDFKMFLWKSGVIRQSFIKLLQSNTKEISDFLVFWFWN